MFIRTVAAFFFFVGLTAVNVTMAQTVTENRATEKPAASEDAALPNDVSRAVKRADICHHLAGEFGGDNSDRDKEVNAALKRNRCLGVNAELQRLAVKYKDQARVLARIKAAE